MVDLRSIIGVNNFFIKIKIEKLKKIHGRYNFA